MDEHQKKTEKDTNQIDQPEIALEEEKKRSEEYLTRLKYAQADLENLKKRCDRQVEDVKKYANERLIVGLLDVVDELNLAVKSSKASGSPEILIQGVEMTLKKLNKLLESEGVSPIECVGQVFDPAKHQAVETVEKENTKECTIIEEVRKGYIMKEKVIRPSVVKVVVKPQSKPQEPDLDE